MENYWLDRWKRGDTGWHQTEVEPILIKHFANLTPRRVFVPLCGKSLDLCWLRMRGHEVIGIELSELALLAFFEENQLSFTKTRAGALTLYKGEGVSILQGDVFALEPKTLGPIGAIYDRAALIALPYEVRQGYAAHLTELAQQCGKNEDFQFLQIVLERTPHDLLGPPYSVPSSEIRLLYGSAFEISLLSREKVEIEGLDADKIEECAYLLRHKKSS